MKPVNGCRHLCSGTGPLEVSAKIVPDLDILRKAPSRNIGKKSITRVQKCVSSFVKQGKGTEKEIIEAMLAAATEHVLRSEITPATDTCLEALHFASMFSLFSESEIESMTNQVLTWGGLISFLAKMIPCDCLASQASAIVSSNKICLHGGGDMRAIKLLAMFNSDDLNIYETRSKVLQALKNNVVINFPGASREEVSSIFDAECFSLAARCTLEEHSLSMDQARQYCKIANVIGYGLFGKPIIYIHVAQQVIPERSRILYVAKQIPCNCLANKKKDAKRAMRTGYCLECRKVLPRSEIFQCSRCKVAC